MLGNSDYSNISNQRNAFSFKTVIAFLSFNICKKWFWLVYSAELYNQVCKNNAFYVYVLLKMISSLNNEIHNVNMFIHLNTSFRSFVTMSIIQK